MGGINVVPSGDFHFAHFKAARAEQIALAIAIADIRVLLPGGHVVLALATDVGRCKRKGYAVIYTNDLDTTDDPTAYPFGEKCEACCG